MPFLVAAFVVILVIVLTKSGVPSSIISLMVPLLFSSVGGTATASFVSFAATPFVGVPVGLMVGVYIFSKLVSLRR